MGGRESRCKGARHLRQQVISRPSNNCIQSATVWGALRPLGGRLIQVVRSTCPGAPEPRRTYPVNRS